MYEMSLRPGGIIQLSSTNASNEHHLKPHLLFIDQPNAIWISKFTGYSEFRNPNGIRVESKVVISLFVLS